MMVNRNACPYCHYTVGHADTCELILGAKTLTELDQTASPAAAPAVDTAALEAALAQPQPGTIFPTAAPVPLVQQQPAPAPVGIRDEPGIKFDADKTRFDLIPFDCLEEVGKVLTYGASKYGERNWERGMSWSRVVGAGLRHTFAMMRGEDRDSETGFLHSAHAICCLMFACSYQLRNHGTDDRKPL